MRRFVTSLYALALSAIIPVSALAADITIDVEVTPSSQSGKIWTALSASAVAGNGGTALSNGYDLSRGLYFGLWLKCAGTGPDVKAEWLESPTKESTDFALGVSIVANHTGTSPLVYNIAPPPMRYGRLKLTGNAGNGANSTCTAKVLIYAPQS